MNKIFVPLIAAILFFGSLFGYSQKPDDTYSVEPESNVDLNVPTFVVEPIEEAKVDPNVPTFVVESVIIQDEWIYPISEEEVDLIAQLVMAEAEGEPEEGKRMVIDVILNRVDHPHYPNNVNDVIYAPAQFSPMWNGRFERCYVKHDIKELVKEELLERTNSEVIYFNAGHYSEYGTPLFQIGDHYFSKRD